MLGIFHIQGTLIYEVVYKYVDLCLNFGGNLVVEKVENNQHEAPPLDSS